MAFLECSFHSDVLGKACSMNVILPQKVSTQIGMNSGSGRRTFPVLYLLHGLSDNHSIWMRRTSIERYVSECDAAVIMPDGERSFYTDMASGARFFTFLSEELPRIVGGFFPISNRREDTFVAGLSMGGYGALKLALRFPERYAGCGALSPVTDMERFMKLMAETPEGEAETAGFFGPERRVPDDCDLFKLAAAAAGLPAADRPKIIHRWGSGDFLLEENRRFRDHLLELGGFDYSWCEAPGCHDWNFWDEHIRIVLEKFFRRG